MAPIPTRRPDACTATCWPAASRWTEPPAPRAAPGTTSPPALTSFVGREREIADIHRLLAQGRLVTLDRGGRRRQDPARRGGRSRTARFAYADGVWFADLVPVADPRLARRHGRGRARAGSRGRL